MKMMHLKIINLLLIILQILTLLYFCIKIHKLKVISCTDCLTRLYNRQQYNKKIINAINRLENKNSHLSLAIIDIDAFKNINDTWGHLAGDKVLKSIADMIKSNIRAHDIAIRWGGEEFVLILPDTGKDEAYALCERIRALIETSSFNNINVTVSMGIASIDKYIKPDILLGMADKALYNAKKIKNSISTIGGENGHDTIGAL